MVKKGDILNGEISNIVGYGAFVKTKDYDGLIHISEISDKFVRNIHDFLSIGQKVRVEVLDVDENSKQLKLSFKSVNKTRGIKVSVPEYKIGFKSLEEKIPEMINEFKKNSF
ncbi:MAG: S1 RNA-binding domain-containing protein [Bacilli bacterium]|jgi:general stress protein 13|nr:S1 RNA-binding domain-containing protein [Bacilli bacterium]MDD2681843.1 S1 RNA-binding domain-containing protein [Bacilli bacterium]MDD3121328.1 S1 RNA-binding domain-containing protein [Bacilli bacterium]MDD4063421.1 S1 RNA-binding domain-containing protein [Bacilli bacterium]MDD4482082.1 S1 RNA-binding domain-containing protein [Bacilli bacterium]